MINLKANPNPDSQVKIRHWISDPNGDIKTEVFIPQKELHVNAERAGSTSALLITYKGKRQLLSAWVEELGLSYSAVTCRFKRGWSIEDTFTKPPLEREELTLTYQDLTLTAKEWAKRLGISKHTILERHRKGLSVEKILSTGRCTSIKLSWLGEEKTISEWGSELGIKPRTIRNRLAKGWTIDRVLTPDIK
jgi:hypothetical protein